MIDFTGCLDPKVHEKGLIGRITTAFQPPYLPELQLHEQEYIVEVFICISNPSLPLQDWPPTLFTVPII